MRKAPANYLITVAVAALLWVGTAIFLGNYLADRVILEAATTEDFIMVYRIILIAAALLGVGNCCFWYLYGGRDSAGADIASARRVWRLSFIAQLALAAVAVIALVLAFSNETFETFEYLLVFGAASVHAWLFFWLCTLFMSPRPVEYVPYGKG